MVNDGAPAPLTLEETQWVEFIDREGGSAAEVDKALGMAVREAQGLRERVEKAESENERLIINNGELGIALVEEKGKSAAWSLLRESLWEAREDARKEYAMAQSWDWINNRKGYWHSFDAALAILDSLTPSVSPSDDRRQGFDAAHLADTKRLAEMVKDHPLMGPQMAQRVEELEAKAIRSVSPSEEKPADPWCYDMEAAPKDGTRVLIALWNGNDPSRGIGYGVAVFYDKWRVEEKADWGFHPPFAWMPLPAAPSVSDGEGVGG